MNTRMFRQMLSLALINVALATITIAAPQKFTGVVSDDMCKQKHMMPGHTDADCTRACAKSGSSYALVAGNEVFILKGDAKQIEKYAGRKVSVTGEVAGSSLQVASIADTK
jgi:hypothetical protein